MINRSTGALRPDGRTEKHVSAVPVAVASTAAAAVAEASPAVPALPAANAGCAGLAVPSATEAAGSARARPGAPATPGPSIAPPTTLPVSRRPRADCTADSAGGLTFDVRFADVIGFTDDAAGCAGDAALLLRRRGGDGPADAVRLPLGTSGTAGTLRAVLPSIMTLPEGRWDAYLLLPGVGPQRLLPGVHDLRSLVDRVPRRGRTWLGVRIPYATKYGNLTVRSWLRWPHAEAGTLRVTDGRMELRGRLYGARLGGTARLEARARDAEAPPVVVPVARDTDAQGGEEGTREGESACAFAAGLPFRVLPATHRVWDLWLRPEEGAEPVRIARILDDVPDKKRIFSYPPQHVSDVDGDRSVRPYYTLDNDLSLRVSCAEAE